MRNIHGFIKDQIFNLIRREVDGAKDNEKFNKHYLGQTLNRITEVLDVVNNLPHFSFPKTVVLDISDLIMLNDGVRVETEHGAIYWHKGMLWMGNSAVKDVHAIIEVW